VGGISSLSFGDEIAFSNAAVHQVITAHPALGKAGILGSPASGYYDRGNALLKQSESMVQPSPKNRRRSSGVLCCTKNNDRVSSL
jgi:hypothetical protein